MLDFDPFLDVNPIMDFDQFLDFYEIQFGRHLTVILGNNRTKN